jgi:hypothetical protein
LKHVFDIETGPALTADSHARAWDRSTASKEVRNIQKDLPEFLAGAFYCFKC